MTAAVRMAVVVRRGDVIGYAGRWRTVEHVHTVQTASGGLSIVFTWQDGGSARVVAGEMLLLGRRPA
ncbi:hypothetical protein ABZ840_10240 [Streptomyces sp. NPDC047117]|uniref:hypothetical protein n=1 Tax=Streptomyces sp. NPDC047117 TaxID=3155379 RepID=UPI003407535A